MSERARHILKLVDQAERTRERNPTLFAAQLHAVGYDRNVLQLAAAVARKKVEKPSVHTRPDHDQVERVDRAWEEKHARKREEKFAARARDQYAERRELRQHVDLLVLHRQALARATAISTVPAGNIEPTRRSSDPVGPSVQQSLEDDPRWDENWTVIRSRLMQVHELIDEAEGHGTVANTMQMLGVEKDRLILHVNNQGLRAQAVVDRLGSHIAGSVETVRRVRRREGYDHLGHPRDTDGRP